MIAWVICVAVCILSISALVVGLVLDNFTFAGVAWIILALSLCGMWGSVIFMVHQETLHHEAVNHEVYFKEENEI